MMEGKILAVCTSEKKGTQKKDVQLCVFKEGHGLVGDAHAGNWHRQVSLLSYEKIEAFRAKGACIDFGAFGENLVVSGFDFAKMPVGTLFYSGSVLLEMTQIGKECHSHCEIFKVMGDCIMPREGVFARVLQAGTLKTGDTLKIAKRYRVAIITASDKGAEGLREDTAGAAIKEIVASQGYDTASYVVLPDEQSALAAEMKRIADSNEADLIFTCGGTGPSKRDVTPEATLQIADRLIPGICEAIRAYSMQITKRAMFSRSVSAIRGNTLIVNLSGSKKAVCESLPFIIGSLRHCLDILQGNDSECGRP
ncbi:MAG: hypothetical protein Ta2G_03320 [Termitinemataceae bacterium]|nr:MAG: hypothetical protein Ta2G_03320 [Termitinemataceae bacterium]